MNRSTTAVDPSSRISSGIMKREDFACSVQSQLNQQASATTSVSATPQKKKRGLPGTPNPEAEVIALSPKSLLATNRFICEVCHKGFQREQNLQLHRRGHNLPWKLKQKSTKEVKKKVYVCPEPTCVHHEPSRALGDLTGIKKHFCRKHGEKKWKCEKCSKKYAVQSDWKAHSKTCGTREYRCDCGTIFSRRDSFITHRAFCDALAQESARLPIELHLYNHHQSSDMLRFQGGSSQFDHRIPSSSSSLRSLPGFLAFGINQDFHEGSQFINEYHGLNQIPIQLSANNISCNNPASNLFNLGFFSNTTIANRSQTYSSHITASGLSIQDQLNNNILNDHISENVSSLYSSQRQNSATLPQISATALLQKAAQLGATSTCNNHDSFLRGFGGSTTNSVGLTWQDQRSSSSSSSFPTSNSSSFHLANLDQMKGNFSSCQESQLQDIMNSIEKGNTTTDFGGIPRARGHEIDSDQLADFSVTNCLPLENQRVELCNLEALEDRRHPISGSALNLGAADRFTRDFLGVGGRFNGGNLGQRDHRNERNLNFASMDPEMKSYNEGYQH